MCKNIPIFEETWDIRTCEEWSDDSGFGVWSVIYVPAWSGDYIWENCQRQYRESDGGERCENLSNI